MEFNRIIVNLFFLFFLVEGAIVAQPIDKKNSDKRDMPLLHTCIIRFKETEKIGNLHHLHLK